MNVLEVNDSNLSEAIKSEQTVVIDCYAPWCGPCKLFAPIFEELSAEVNDVKFCKINTEENQKPAEEYSVMSIPTVLVFKNGQLAGRETGLKTKQEIKNLL